MKRKPKFLLMLFFPRDLVFAKTYKTYYFLCITDKGIEVIKLIFFDLNVKSSFKPGRRGFLRNLSLKYPDTSDKYFSSDFV